MTHASRVVPNFVIARKGTVKISKEMIHGGDCIGEAGRDKLFTPMYFMVGVKPKHR